ncbi:hypothetical protein [Ruminiclostridium cellobioparum]|uniref:hypothetical protein n=1 Tax=Ruminiclostridium cellobioparum TaxID=29355 RepID=UPI0028A7D269|nr:hypothetical protein [Ruminiclostridium cellobioparum]
MRSIAKRLITLMVAVAITISTAIPVMAEYDNSKVYTTIDGVKYYMDGTKLMKDGKKVVNFRELTYKYQDTEITAEMMKTLLVTDLTHDKYNGHNIIYAVGLVFKPEPIDYNDTSSYKNGLVKVGTPYMLVISYCMDAPTKDIEWYKDKYLIMEGIAKYDPLWDAPYTSELDESKDPTEDDTKDMLYNFAAKVVHPRIIMSAKYSHKAYILAQDVPSDDVPSDHIKLFSFNTDRNLATANKTIVPELYMTFWWLNDFGKKYGDYEVKLDRFYIKEQKKDVITVYNFGEEISVAVSSNISEYSKPVLENMYWQYTEQLPIE